MVRDSAQFRPITAALLAGLLRCPAKDITLEASEGQTEGLSVATREPVTEVVTGNQYRSSSQDFGGLLATLQELTASWLQPRSLVRIIIGLQLAINKTQDFEVC